MARYHDNWGLEQSWRRGSKTWKIVSFLVKHVSILFIKKQCSPIISIFRELIKEGWNKSGGGEWKEHEGDDYLLIWYSRE